MTLKQRVKALYSNRWNRICISLSLSILLLFVLIFLTVRFSLRGVYEGLYLLTGPPGEIFELKDTILLGEYERVLLKLEFGALFSDTMRNEARPQSTPHFRYVWHDDDGEGYIKSFFPDGTKFIVSFGRFKDSIGAEPEGLFIGGGLPYNEYEDAHVTMNETGMAFYDGKDWRHLWCNANEALRSALHPDITLYPSQWKFLGSSVLYATQRKLIVESRHEVVLDNVPLRINRFAIYRSGERHIILAIKIMNIGSAPAGLYYIYGDEPWVGRYGSSRGNVGWAGDRLFNYESAIDLRKYTHAGMFDFGNKALKSEQGEYTRTANFMEWLENTGPDIAYFSNRMGVYSDEKKKAPLADAFNRVIALEWGPRLIAPGRSENIILAIGMADLDPKTGRPAKPTVKLNLDELAYILNRN